MSVVLMFAPMCQKALCGSARCRSSRHAPAGVRSTLLNNTSMSLCTAGYPATVVRVALGHTLRYQAIAFSGSTEFNPTWCKRGIDVAHDCAGDDAEWSRSTPRTEARTRSCVFIDSLVRQE